MWLVWIWGPGKCTLTHTICSSVCPWQHFYVKVLIWTYTSRQRVCSPSLGV